MKWEKGILWFRNDLRLHDHEALHRALENVNQVIPVYLFDPRQWGESQYGLAKTGSFRAQFLLESLQDLKDQLAAKGSTLLIQHGKPEEILPQLARNLGAGGVFTHREVGTEEKEIEAELERQLFKAGIGLETYWGQTLYHLNDLPMPLHSLPNVFTQFRKQAEKDAAVREPYPSPQQIPTPEGLPTSHFPDLSDFSLSSTSFPPGSVLPFKGGETAGKKRLAQWIWENDHLKQYKKTRNGMLGEAYSSKFSPWLSMGCLSPRYIYQEIRAYEKARVKNSSTYWLYFELVWRDYFHFVTQRFDDQLFRLRGLKQRLPDNWPQVPAAIQQEHFEQWIAGQTGVPFIDGNMRELAETGFMSNRGRQNVASFLVKDLGVDWRLGAAWFEANLIDYSVASNWGNWTYVAGVGNDPREHRYFNTLSQAQRYDVKGSFVRHWLPELAALPSQFVHQPWLMGRFQQEQYGVILGADYPHPIIKMPGSIHPQGSFAY